MRTLYIIFKFLFVKYATWWYLLSTDTHLISYVGYRINIKEESFILLNNIWQFLTSIRLHKSIKRYGKQRCEDSK